MYISHQRWGRPSLNRTRFHPGPSKATRFWAGRKDSSALVDEYWLALNLDDEVLRDGNSKVTPRAGLQQDNKFAGNAAQLGPEAAKWCAFYCSKESNFTYPHERCNLKHAPNASDLDALDGTSLADYLDKACRARRRSEYIVRKNAFQHENRTRYVGSDPTIVIGQRHNQKPGKTQGSVNKFSLLSTEKEPAPSPEKDKPSTAPLASAHNSHIAGHRMGLGDFDASKQRTISNGAISAKLSLLSFGCPADDSSSQSESNTAAQVSSQTGVDGTVMPVAPVVGPSAFSSDWYTQVEEGEELKDQIEIVRSKIERYESRLSQLSSDEYEALCDEWEALEEILERKGRTSPPDPGIEKEHAL
ncbi:hypothetical protein SLS58_000179 [Diplodia intermedia]|uniref:Uncharacterized protein n=1 Tax=Diplodia intermedia TaxID=856260 RepID=A0ABR3U511_9PEZI